MQTNLQVSGPPPMGGQQMGVLITPTNPGGDTLPFAVANTVPMATGASWMMQLLPCYNVLALGTLATGTTTFNWAASNYYTLTCYAGAMTFAFSNVQPGQSIRMFITGAGSAAITWPSTFTWIGLTAAPAASAVAPVVTSATVLVDITCTTLGNYIGSYITS